MKNLSIWLKNIKFDKPKIINKDLNVDVLIIGGGITGLSSAYHLIKSNLKVCVVEKNLIAHGVTSRTTGKLTYLQDNNNPKLYYEAQKDAIKIVKKIIKDNNINCDLEKIDSHLFYNKDIDNNFNINKSIKINNSYVFHPIKYLIELKRIIEKNGIEVYENTCIYKIKKNNSKYICISNNNIIIANKVVIASHYPYFILPYLFPFKTYIEKSYISASIINEHNKYSAISIDNPIKSIRFYNNYFIYITGSHKLSKNYNYKNNFDNLLNDINKYNVTNIWSNHDIMTADSMPLIGFIDNNLLIGTGYNTWGMTNGSIAGKIISDLILNKNNKYSKLFNPKRNIISLKYPLYMSYSIKPFIENKINYKKNWYSNIIFTKINNKKAAIYTDENNKKHAVYITCPHLKCTLLFNEIEKTWDCPCHGSRFDIDGNSITGPSNYNISIKNEK